MISNCGKNENGGGRGGRPGDQTGQEYRVMNWYSRPWKCVLRYPDLSKAKVIAEVARDAANNSNIGYDLDRRMTFYNQLQSVGWRPASITTPCDADCSSATATSIVAAGHLTGDSTLSSIYAGLSTYNMRAALVSKGFQLLTDSRYLTGDSYLLPGDVLLNDDLHAAINLDSGSNSGQSINVSGGSGISGGGGMYGNLYPYLNDEDDAVVREVCYFSGSNPTTSATNVKLSVINYTASLQGIFKGWIGSGSNSSVDSSKLPGNYKIIFDYCISKGLNAAAGCGICANIKGESNANPNAVSSDGYGSIGICQWTNIPKGSSTGRKTNLVNFLHGNWKNNLSGQLDFLWQELNSSYRSSVLVPIQQVPNTEAGARQAADIFVRKFEVPANVDLRSKQRQQWASEFWSMIIIQQTVSSGGTLIVTNTGGPRLTKSAGRVTFNGHTETWYSQKVLPGGGLNIPGRHVAPDGTIRDKDNYICVACDDLPKGALVMTSLGMGKVYDKGSGKNNVDIYVNW